MAAGPQSHSAWRVLSSALAAEIPRAWGVFWLQQWEQEPGAGGGTLVAVALKGHQELALPGKYPDF